jgi:SAM-dependent methyltransferase
MSRERMGNEAREILKEWVPKSLRYHLKNKFRYVKSCTARKAFENAPRYPEWLSHDLLETLQERYDYPRLISYAPEDRERAAERTAKKIIRVLGSQASRSYRFLDVGCAEGMVCGAVNRKGKFAVGIDIRIGFSSGPADHRMPFLQMDASRLGFKDESFDCVFSMASFEHFSDPRSVLEEAIRVVRKGGWIYLHFGPLYLSHYGLHAYRSITVPYCHCLFDRETLMEFCHQKNLTPPDFESLNKWSLADFRRLWGMYSSRLHRVRYYEYLNTDHVDLITLYPSCFKSKTGDFMNLIVPEVEVLFQKLR